ncbi:MAG: hypothetical protein JNM79_16495 [Burkholderiales bacterium]|nr:hypothetical protein [Burkholderiales bacterium]
MLQPSLVSAQAATVRTGFDMLELGVGADILRAAGWVYVGLALICGAAALIWTPKWWGKLIALVLVLGAFAYLPVTKHIEARDRANAWKAKYEAVMAMFQKRCESAGEKITRVVENVEGIMILKPRPAKWNLEDQFELNDPYAGSMGGDSYIMDYLVGRTKSGKRESSLHTRNAFRYVDVVDAKDNVRYRYRGIPTSKGPHIPYFELVKSVAEGPAPRYGVTWADLSTKLDRENWIAGSSLQVIDTSSGEVIAERIGYMVDPGLGNRHNARAPWAFAARAACPAFEIRSASRTIDYDSRNGAFVYQVLKPHRTEK